MPAALAVDGGLDPPSSPGTRSIKHSSLLGDPANDAGQDWSQWMRWDWDDSSFTANSDAVADLSTIGLDQISSANAAQSNADNLDFTTCLSPLASFSDSRNWDSSLHSKRRIASSSSSYWKGRDSENNTTSLSPSSISPLSRKRKTTSDDDGSAGMDDDSPPESKKGPAKKRSHNVIEKRYRANLNEKIAELRDSVPSLRGMSKQGGSPADEDAEDVTPASKLNKASILSKATEYIRHLELRNKRLEEENKALKTRLRQVDKAMDQSATISTGSASSPSSYTGTLDSSMSSPPSVFSHVEEPSTNQKSISSAYPAEGLIKVPDYIKQMRASAATQGPFAESYIKDDRKSNRESDNERGRRGMTLTNKFMLGTIAGLMVIEGVSTQKKADTADKGLLAVPLSFLDDKALPYLSYWHGIVDMNLNVNMNSWHSWHTRAIWHFLLTAGFVLLCAFVVFVYLFNSSPPLQRNSPKTAFVSSTKMTPSEIRRQAWLTSIQRVGVPSHRFFVEWLAVTSRWVEYMLGCILGWKLYSWITGITEDDEKGRIKTWDIAIDAQLAGGDSEVSKSRLVLTIFASGTLPRSPMRTMLKALHCRLLLWRVGEPGSLVFRVCNDVARLLARYQWSTARDIYRSMPKDHPDALPSHIAALLDVECDEVMIDPVIQRATNLIWNRPTQEATDDDEALLDVVVEDSAIQSSIDSLAAWYSSHVLQQALLQSFKVRPDDSSFTAMRAQLRSNINLALNVAPRPSAAYTRALAMKAILFEEDRVKNIGVVLAALPSKKDRQTQASNFLDSSIPISVREEIAIAARCAMVAAIMKARATNDTTFPSYLTIRKAITWFNQLPLDPVELTLVGFAAVYHLLHIVATYGDLLSSSSSESSGSSPSSPMSAPASLSAASTSTVTESLTEGPQDKTPRTAQVHRRTQSDGAADPAPQYGRVAGDLMYWARHAYNPAFYGFTTNLIDAVEAGCVAVCKDVGIDVASQAPSIKSSLRKMLKAEQKQHKQSSNSTTNEREPRSDKLKEQNPQRQSPDCHDTGYGSESQGDDLSQAVQVTPSS